MRAIRGFKPEGASVGLEANGHGLKGVVSPQIIMVRTNADLALFADMARPDLLCQEGIHPIEIEQHPFEFGLKRSPRKTGQGI